MRLKPHKILSHLSVLLCIVFFTALLVDTVKKYNQKMTNIGIIIEESSKEEKMLPCVTACPWSAFKNPGLHYSTEIFKKSTFDKEEIFMNITDLSPFNESLYEIEEIKSVFMGRCYMVCPLQPQKKLTLDYLALKNDKEIKGCLSLLLRSDIGPACFTCQIIFENV